MLIDLFHSLLGTKQSRLIVLDIEGREQPMLVNQVMLSFRGVAESTRRLNNSEFILIDRVVYIVKWKKS